METLLKSEISKDLHSQHESNEGNTLFARILKDWNVIYTSEIENLEKIKQLEKFIGNTLKEQIFDKKNLSSQDELFMIDFIGNLNEKKENLWESENMVFTNDPHIIMEDSKDSPAWRLHKKFQSSHAIKAK
ncbi:hypothetical protein VB264_24060 [Arcicella aquatica]|uniref:Uncharacterized protein n=1 Tax=Arcicella aquatica TaxID=217141 RepID=A0ABU5QUW2_9BACT|nr:hypothetical protein [Arcicella aquatica]MEA5260895.1 hypothetical protein [Arcicella aquatica]